MGRAVVGAARGRVKSGGFKVVVVLELCSLQERARLLGGQHDGQSFGALCAGDFASPPDVQAKHLPLADPADVRFFRASAVEEHPDCGADSIEQARLAGLGA